MPNLFANLPNDLPEELFQTLASADCVRVERIVSRGHASPEGFWYDQQQHEFVALLQGAATLVFEGEPTRRDLRPGDWVLIDAHRRHRVAWTAPDEATVWLAVHFDPPGGPCLAACPRPKS